ncbi:MAG: response regulator [Candidatus Riflebacteria bacterium]|nr:response regulator [Candidatus Riflebacteria bacterium]
MSVASVWVLLVDDNPGDVELVQSVLEERGTGVLVSVAQDGDEALARLCSGTSIEGTQLPRLIVLDWNLPRTSGREVLARVRADPRTRRIPVVVLTTSCSDRDVELAYDLGASCYLVKPMRLAEFRAVLGLLREFWLRVAVLPGGTGPTS